MQVLVNGDSHEFDSAPTVAELLARIGAANRRVAVEVNREIVPRSRHDTHRLADGDAVELVHAIGGG